MNTTLFWSLFEIERRGLGILSFVNGKELWKKYVVGKIKEAEFQVCHIQKSLERVGWTAELAQEVKKDNKSCFADLYLRES